MSTQDKMCLALEVSRACDKWLHERGLLFSFFTGRMLTEEEKNGRKGSKERKMKNENPNENRRMETEGNGNLEQ